VRLLSFSGNKEKINKKKKEKKSFEKIEFWK